MAEIGAEIHKVIMESNAISYSLVSVTEDLSIGNGKNVQQVVGESWTRYDVHRITF